MLIDPALVWNSMFDNVSYPTWLRSSQTMSTSSWAFDTSCTLRLNCLYKTMTRRLARPARATGYTWYVLQPSRLKPPITDSPCKTEARAHCNIAFGEMVVNLPERHVRDEVDALLAVLIGVLDDAPHIDYDRSLSWDGEHTYRYVVSF